MSTITKVMVLVFTTMIAFFSFFFWNVERLNSKNAERHSVKEVEHAISSSNPTFS